MGIINFLTLVNTLFKHRFKYDSVLLTHLISENLFSFATNISTDPLKLFLFIPAVSELALTFCIVKFLDEYKWYTFATLDDMEGSQQSAGEGKDGPL